MLFVIHEVASKPFRIINYTYNDRVSNKKKSSSPVKDRKRQRGDVLTSTLDATKDFWSHLKCKSDNARKIYNLEPFFFLRAPGDIGATATATEKASDIACCSIIAGEKLHLSVCFSENNEKKSDAQTPNRVFRPKTSESF